MNWSSLRSSKCENRDSFLSFYSKTKGILNKPNKGNSIAAKDAIFIHAYFSMDIEVTELQTEVKVFLCDTNVTYSETLELIHADFRVQKTGEHPHEMTKCSESTDIMRRDKTDDDVNLKKTDAPLKTTRPFPNNHSKLLSSEY